MGADHRSLCRFSRPALWHIDAVVGRPPHLVEVLPAAQPSPAHAAAVEDQREAPLDDLGTQLERYPGDAGQLPGSVVDDGAAGGIIPVPA